MGCLQDNGSAPPRCSLASLICHVSTTKPPLVPSARASALRSVLPRPRWGFADRLRSCRYGGFATLPAFLLRPFRAALGLPGGLSPLGLRLPLCFLCFLQLFRSLRQMGFPASRPSLRVAAQALTPAPLSWRHCERKQRKNRRGSAAEAAERLRRACQAQGNLDNPPGRAFAVTNAGRKS